MNVEDLLAADRAHVWHPYASMVDPLPVQPVVRARDVRLVLADGRELIDGMSSWWAAIHGYAHPVLDEVVRSQLDSMAHVMLGGLTHEPVVRLAQLLVDITPEPLTKVFFCDSGSVAVEIALKMAVQHEHARGYPRRTRFLTIRSGYHGDTSGAMSVCDPVTGMHHLFSAMLARQVFAPAPPPGYDAPVEDGWVEQFERLLVIHRDEIAGVVLEPVVQGAGGMRFFAPGYLRRLRALCDAYDVLLIFDEIATGFGRTGRLFASHHAGVAPDILCLGKAMTGGYVSMAATLCTSSVADVICSGEGGAFMHGPTFMGNPLAASVSRASIEVLLASPWQSTIDALSQRLRQGLSPAATLPGVADVRVLGAIGVVEMRHPVDMRVIQPLLVDLGVWVRPFGRLVYLMPPYIVDEADTKALTSAVVEAIARST
ncbi:MAG TPA: adenosylmethionine--8-amino-7-oxononanoate transaminase [Actinomycetes bacterium]|nr:adenosylmethionine--8-amino-7-oxononanoate transaminase [Actinomycetes bacterium]